MYVSGENGERELKATSQKSPLGNAAATINQVTLNPSPSTLDHKPNMRGRGTMINAFTHLDPDPRNPNPGTSLCPVACTWDKGGIRKLNPEHQARIARRQRPRELNTPLL